jgi:hypothetical protein
MPETEKMTISQFLDLIITSVHEISDAGFQDFTGSAEHEDLLLQIASHLGKAQGKAMFLREVLSAEKVNG